MDNFTVPSDGFSNIGGVASFWFSPINKVQSIPDINSTQRAISDPVTWRDGGEWLKGYSTFRQCKLSIRSGFGPNGKNFDAELTGFYPGLDTIMSDLLEEMQGQEFIILALDHEGNQLLLGSIDEPMIFTLKEWNSSDVGQGMKGYAFAFARKFSKRPPFYLPTPETSALGIGAMAIGSTFKVY